VGQFELQTNGTCMSNRQN